MTAESWVRITAWLSGALYALTLAAWLLRSRTASLRLLWTASWAVFLLHVVLAFHVHHHWSHHEAWEHTQRISGYGDGIFLNYAAILLWTFDVLWWGWPRSQQARPRWAAGLIHGYLLFLWFNAAVLFPVMKLWGAP